MKKMGNKKLLKQTILSGAITTALSVGLGLGVATPSQADIYNFSFTASTTKADGGLFTMLSSTGIPLVNTSNPYYSDPTWAYGRRTQISGTLSFNTATGAGTGTINPFAFYNGGNAVASGIKFQSLATPTSPSSLMLGNMNFAWNGNSITTQIVLDGSGLFAAIGSGAATVTGAVFGPIYCALSTSGCATPASNGIKNGKIPIGPVPIATSTYNTAGQHGVGTVLSDLTLGTDDGIGGSPMDNGPFNGFNANFDIQSVTVKNFTDTTPPVLTLNATPNGTDVVTLVVNVDSYTEPGATCNDAPPLASYTSTVASPTGGPVDNTTIGTTSLTYTCTDASGNTATKTRTVKVVGPNAVITLLANVNNQIDPVTQECAVPYADAGATCTDGTDGNIPVSGNGTTPGTFQVNTTAVTFSTPGSYSAIWSCTDSQNITKTLSRTVKVVDTTPPVITINGNNPDNVVSSTPINPFSYIDQSATATDSCDTTAIGVTTTNPFVTNPADINVPDTGPATLTYKVKYVAVDASMNTATVFRTVNVTRSQPVITLNGPSTVVLSVGATYVEDGINITDAQDGDLIAVTTDGTTPGVGAGVGNLTHNIVIRDATSAVVSAIDTSINGGRYTITYSVTDSNGNKATPVTRKVNVGAFAVGSNFTMLDSSGSVFGGTNDVVFTWDGSFNTSVNDTTTRMTIASAKPQPFFSFLWTAHDIQVFGPGSYSFDTTCTTAQLKAGTTVCNNPLQSGQKKQFITMTVGTGQVGAHILFDWGKPSSSTICGVANCNIDVVNVWNVNGVWNQHGDKNPRNQLFDGPAGIPPNPTTTWKLVSTDVNGDGINSSPMVDGPFQGFYANFNAGPAGKAGPRKPYVNTQPDTQYGSALASMNVFGLLVSLLALVGLRFNRKANKK